MAIDPEDIEVLETIVVPALKRHAEIGWTRPVEGMLAAQTPIALASGREDIIEAFAEAERWLAETKEMEALHGRNCRLNVNHPAYVEAQAHRARKAQ